MAVQIENLGSVDRKTTLEFARADLAKLREARLAKVGKTMKVAGFRPGKVPKSMVEKQYGMQVDFELQFDKASDLFYELCQKEGIPLAGQPRLEPKSELEAETIAFDVFFEVLPEVKMGDFSAAEVTKYTTDIGEAEIDRAIDVLRKQQVHYHARGEAGAHGDGGANTAAQNGDQVVIDFVGKLDGVEFAGGKAENFEFVLGEGRMLPEFEAAALGLKVGESKSFPLTFPADYHGKDVAGKTAEFTITVKSVNWAHMPVVDDAFALSLGVAEGGVAKMREEVKENLDREVKRRITSLLKSEVMDKLNALCELDVPKSLVTSEQERLVQSARQDLMQRGVPNAKDAPIPAEIFAEQATKRVRLGLILGELVKKQNLAATTDQIKAEIEEQAATYEDPKEVVRWYYSNPSRLKDIENLVLEDNVIKHFTSLAKVVDKAITFEELSKLN
ncbi:trigger factor [Polynucleobacter asymbioticus]|uniref:Trigger factor n=1 Tax=Polynucleobacter asymbioticus TaxID=576611 RepID=A0AAC9IQY5_9BURK|nr:trigger factor [Polynucleobacter asymbioticus]APB98801.1 trigger factor [Polynucleobacter asymbioticus]APC01104.1 trigger factor [Polynucleobacter asymbioticus]